VRKKFLLSILLGSLGFAVGCGGGSGSSSNSNSSGAGSSGSNPSTGANVLAIAVDGGPAANKANGDIYPNGAFASATICAPGSSSNCVTVDHLLVDTGSYGLRVLESAVSSLNLSAVKASNGSAAYDCVSFVDGSFLWGPVEAASVTLGGEKASDVPIQVISSSTLNVPTSCGTNLNEDQNAQSSLGANGILGVGLEPADCGPACDPSAGGSPPAPAYYTCASLPCLPAFVTEANQVTNPVVAFSTDNNGVIVELPAVSGSSATVSGSLIFGIGTESNNQLSSSATVFQPLVCDSFTTIFESQSLSITDPSQCSGPGSFIDSGSNGLFFPDVNNSIPTCSNSTPFGDLSEFYCPSSAQSLSATNEVTHDTSITKKTPFTVGNALNLFTAAPTDAAFGTLAGLNPQGFGFDWGLPFFYGVHVYSAIDGQVVANPAGAPSPPWWAY
jgi:hypothetical protein